MKRFSDRIPHILLAAYVVLFIWGAIAPYDRAVWWAENIPILLVVLTLVVLYMRGVRFSALAYILMSILPYWHTIGGHYTFERVPFDWFSRAFGFERNMYDRIGHFSVGFYAFGIAEYLVIRKQMSVAMACLFAIFAISFVAMSYELIEWVYAAYGGNAEAGANFLGSQGDIWDAQKDMLMDTLGEFLGVRVLPLNHAHTSRLTSRCAVAARPLPKPGHQHQRSLGSARAQLFAGTVCRDCCPRTMARASSDAIASPTRFTAESMAISTSESDSDQAQPVIPTVIGTQSTRTTAITALDSVATRSRWRRYAAVATPSGTLSTAQTVQISVQGIWRLPSASASYQADCMNANHATPHTRL